MIIGTYLPREDSRCNNDEHDGDEGEQSHHGVQHHHDHDDTDELEEVDDRLLGDTENELLKSRRIT